MKYRKSEQISFLPLRLFNLMRSVPKRVPTRGPTKLIVIFIFCLVLSNINTYAITRTDYPLGKFSEGSVDFIYQDVEIPTYLAYDTNYIAVADLRLLGFEVICTTTSGVINIIPPTSWSTPYMPVPPTASTTQIPLDTYSMYTAPVYLNNFQTHCLTSHNRTFIPLASLSELGSLNIIENTCTFTPTGAPPVKANKEYIINLSNVPVQVTLLDIYYTTKSITYTNTFTLAPGETLSREPNTQTNGTYISTFVKKVSGPNINYSNGSYRGQLNPGLFSKYIYLKDHPFHDNYGSETNVDNVIWAENTINQKNLSSPTPYLVWTNTSRQRTYIFTGSKNNWKLMKCFVCSSGLDITPTPHGTFALTYKVPSFGQAKGYCCKYAFGFIGTSYLYHSIIYDKTGTYLLENKGVLGRKASQGCIRFSVENAKWFYDNMLPKTTVFID